MIFNFNTRYLETNAKILLLQTQDLRVSQANKSYIRLSQENLIEDSVQDYLSYILNTDSLCSTTFSLKANIC